MLQDRLKLFEEAAVEVMCVGSMPKRVFVAAAAGRRKWEEAEWLRECSILMLFVDGWYMCRVGVRFDSTPIARQNFSYWVGGLG